MRYAALFIALLLLVAGGIWWWSRPTHPPVVKRSLYETDMVENLVRGLLTELKPPAEPVCFLAFGDGTTSPSHIFMRRFAGTHPELLACGAAAMPPGCQQFETSSGRPGLMIHIVKFKEFTPGTFDVVVSFSNLPAGKNRFIYRIANLGGEWKIRSCKAA